LQTAFKNGNKDGIPKADATTAKALGEILTSNYIQGLERLSAIFHKFGYKGFPVKIEVPKKIS
jgi:hypothetical protein